MGNKLETFNKKHTFVYGAEHQIAPPVYETDEDLRSSVNLNPDASYRVEFDSKYWLAHFAKWHGAHCLFYVPKRHNYIAVWQDELRRIVKRIRPQHTCTSNWETDHSEAPNSTSTS